MPTKALMEAELKVCFNSKCRKATENPKNGWRCRSGQFAELCDPCAGHAGIKSRCTCRLVCLQGHTLCMTIIAPCSAYVEGKFCETFHSNLPGWRFCETCGKQIHCGCIVSFHLFVLLDTGGIECLLCTRKSFILQPNPAWPQPSLCLPSHPEGIKDLPAKNYSSVAGSGPVPWLQAPNLFNGSSIMSDRQTNASSEMDLLGSSHIRLADQQSACSLNLERNDNSVERLLSGSTGLSCGLVKGNPVVHGDRNNSSVHGSHHSNSSKSDPSFQNTDVALVYPSYTSVNKIDKANNNTATTRKSPTMSTTFNGNGSNHNGSDTSTNLKACGVNVKGDGQGKSQLLTQYSSPTTDQLQRIPEANCVFTPLFEKTLSASDAGKIGRLVLPKKCAEAYLPQISHSEGLPLEVLDAKGNKWVFQFRFWPNNNSRMYVLEGITPCLQALQLRAGDIVTFGRLEPEGKLVVGCRKTSISSSPDQGNEAITTGGGISAKRENKIKAETTMKRSKRDEVNIISGRPTISGCGLTTVGRVEENTVNHIKRKGSTLASRHKHMKIDSGDLLELKITCSQAQGLLRPPPDAITKIIIIEGFEFEEYEAAPIIGRPTLHSSDDLGEEILWVQCDDCLKWRKMPGSTLLPSRWTCSANLQDPMRSICSAAQELMTGHLGDLLSTVSNACISKTKPAKQGLNRVRASEVLGKVANLVIREEEGASEQSPNGKGSENKKPCDYSASVLVNKQKLEKDAETVVEKPEHDSNVDLCSEAGTCTSKPNVEICTPQIDLNSRPKREEEFASNSSSARLMNLLGLRPGQCEDLTDTAQTQAELSARSSSRKALEGSSQRTDLDCHVAVAGNTVASTALL